MDRGIYPILSGALAVERRMQLFANNLANVNTAGFKQDTQAFRAVIARRMIGPVHRATIPAAGNLLATRSVGATERVFVAPHGTKTAFEPGRIRLTGNPLDVAIQGEGFFEIKTPQGFRYTRNGMFSLDNQRRLVTHLGYPVMGLTGELTIPPGMMHISSQGTIQVDGRTVGTIKVVEFPAEAMPTKQGEGLFFGEKAKPLKNPQIQVGYLEESNVSAIGEMVNMIEGMRTYESAQKVIQTFDRIAEVAIQDVGKVG
ncbi:MAG TPA: flagellar basal-body rod protein FlgF [Nitrospiraceae bacterium]|jgi:flagellar basal-body rod protein FlgG|nr:flagellar basal-body rod protein FlgF [Nitrospiraceae bacterium]